MALKYNQRRWQKNIWQVFKQMEETVWAWTMMSGYLHLHDVRRSLRWKNSLWMRKRLWSGLEKGTGRRTASSLYRPETTEGENLKKDIIGKLDGMLEVVARVEERSPQIVAEYREKLEDESEGASCGHPD